jgi:hypothetical protein
MAHLQGKGVLMGSNAADRTFTAKRAEVVLSPTTEPRPPHLRSRGISVAIACPTGQPISRELV